MTTPDITEVFGDETKCEERLDPLWKLADEIGCYPASTADVVCVLRKGGGFDVSLELLENWVRSGMVPNVSMKAGQWGWSSQNVVVAATHAETWRRWIILAPRHIHKLTAMELMEAEANAAGSTAFTDGDTFDVNAFVEVLSRCEDSDMRHAFAVALKTKLRNLGVLDK